MGGLRKHIPFTYWMMMIGTLALTGFPLDSPASSPRTRSSRPPSPATTRSPATPSCCSVVAALLTSFYSWRLIFMTFHGEPRADHEVMHHVA